MDAVSDELLTGAEDFNLMLLALLIDKLGRAHLFYSGLLSRKEVKNPRRTAYPSNRVAQCVAQTIQKHRVSRVAVDSHERVFALAAKKADAVVSEDLGVLRFEPEVWPFRLPAFFSSRLNRYWQIAVGR